MENEVEKQFLKDIGKLNMTILRDDGVCRYAYIWCCYAISWGIQQYDAGL